MAAADAASAAAAADAAATGEEAAPTAATAATAAVAVTHRYRTSDVESDASSFADLLLPAPLVQALAAAGFERPSPVQKLAIPLGLVGTDLIVQAKSGTGKTCVFAVIALQSIQADVPTPQVMVVAPTREVALQSSDVITRVAAGLPAPSLSCIAFVGGLPTAEDQKRLRRTCQVVVGTPGRLCALVGSGAMPLRSLRTLVLDEADQLLGEGFYSDVAWLHAQLPAKKQVLAFSATYTPDLLADLEPLTRRAQKVLLCEETVSLRGIRQFYKLVHEGAQQEHRGASAAGEDPLPADAWEAEQQRLLTLKVEALLQLLSGVSFHQAVVFCNRKPAAEWLARRLSAAGYPSAHLSSDLAQPDRMAAMEALRGFRLRVMVCTDVMARGVDLDRVNLVALLDAPPDAATYVHRVGRTGRFGTRGVSVAFATAAELERLKGYVAEARAGELSPLPDALPPDLYMFELEAQWEREALAELQAAPTATPPDSPPPVRRQKRQQQQEEEEEEGDASEFDDGGEVAHTSAAASQEWGAWEAWQQWQAWQHWQAWQAYYASAQPPEQQQQQQQQQAVVWQRHGGRSSSHLSDSGTWQEGGDAAGSEAGAELEEGERGGPLQEDGGEGQDEAEDADASRGSSDDGSGSVSAPGEDEMDPHARALLSGLVVAVAPVVYEAAGGGAAKAAGRGYAAAGAPQLEEPSCAPVAASTAATVARQPPPAAQQPQAVCPKCHWKQTYATWRADYVAWQQEYSAWRAWSGWAAMTPAAAATAAQTAAQTAASADV